MMELTRLARLGRRRIIHSDQRASSHKRAHRNRLVYRRGGRFSGQPSGLGAGERTCSNVYRQNPEKSRVG